MALRDSRAFYLVGRFFRLGPAGEPADVYTNAGDFGFARPIRVSDMSLADLFFASGSRGIVTKRDGTHNLKIETIRRPAFDDVDPRVIGRRVCLLTSFGSGSGIEDFVSFTFRNS